MKKVAVVGAGLVGSLQAVFLAQKGFEVDVFERRPDLRKAALLAGRSINLALSDRGWKALEKIGIDQEIKEIAIPMYGRKMHALDGSLTFQPYGKENQAIYSVSRGGLNQRLMNWAEKFPKVHYRFNLRCKDVDLHENTLVFENELTHEEEKYSYPHIFGTDGAFSPLRLRLQQNPLFNYQQTYLTHGYKELVIPANADGTHKMDKNCLHIWPRGEFMMIALPNLDGSFTVTLFFPLKGKLSFESIKTTDDVKDFFEKTFADTVELMPSLLTDYFENPTSTLITVRCSPWNFEDKVLLMGDAAHAIVPFYGQGMNAGFEDCTIFDEMFTKNDGNWGKSFHEFSEKHCKDGEAIAELALNNYIEMRDKTADPDFLLRKKIERKFSERHPELWLPLYELVTFSHIPYSEALKKGMQQKIIMDEIMVMEDIHETWDEEKIMRILQSKVV
jgi:kynurenine 3-monooxygenase